jgi:hypothetical protein
MLRHVLEVRNLFNKYIVRIFFFSVVLQPKSGLVRVVFEVPKSHNKHKRRTAIPPAGFEPVVAAKRLKRLRPPAATS